MDIRRAQYRLCLAVLPTVLTVLAVLPAAAQDETAEPEVPQPEAAEPGAPQPVPAAPGAPQPVPAAPGAPQPGAPQPVPAAPGAPQPGAPQPVPAAPEAAAQPPAAGAEARPEWTPETRSRAIEALEPRYREWLQSVIGLLTVRELDYFLGLGEDFRRDAFMEAFWRPRDPDPRTPRNELRERWDEYRRAPGGFPYGDPRFLAYLLNGPPGGWTLPDGRPVARCFSRTRELEIWFYGRGSRVERELPIIFLRRFTGSAYEAYRPGENLRTQQRVGLPTQDVRLLCADELIRYTLSEITRTPDYDALLERALTPPMPSPEWLDRVTAGATDLPPGAETFEVDAQIAFPHRNQSRTAIQVLVVVDRDVAPGRTFEGTLYHDFRLAGEVIRDGRLFDSFRYRFEGPTPEGAGAIPLGFTRYLRPGPASVRILLEDAATGRYARVVREIEVPSPEGLEALAAPLERPATGPTLELVAPSGDVLAGLTRFRARARGEIDRVTFYLDGKPVLSKRSPPYSVELDLGPAATPHRLRAVATLGEREVASDELWLNQGAPRFRVRIVEPQAGGIYPGSFIARVEVEAPEGERPERVELYVGEQQVAVMTEPPYARGMTLPGKDATVVRAVAYLADDVSAEDAVVVNTSAFVEAVEVRLVELPVRVTGADGRPIPGLVAADFRVFEDGEPQTITRFEPPGETPLRVALLIDRSSSMAPYLGTVTAAAADFAARALRTPEDRLALFSFADHFTVDANFSPAPEPLARAFAGLRAEGGTALYDSLVQTLNSFAGESGAVLLFSDGRDEQSRLSYAQTLETARRTGVAVYALGLEAAFQDKPLRALLEELAAETGGRAFFLETIDEVDAVYATILDDLRARYLLAYQPGDGGGEAFREIRVEVDVPGAEVRTRRGYVP